jgi:hypothetical protein
MIFVETVLGMEGNEGNGGEGWIQVHFIGYIVKDFVIATMHPHPAQQ